MKGDKSVFVDAKTYSGNRGQIDLTAANPYTPTAYAGLATIRCFPYDFEE